MRCLFTCQSGSGHFHPLVPIARALTAVGHEVAFACPPSELATVQRLGFTALAGGLDPEEPGRVALRREMFSLPYREAPIFNHRRVWIGFFAPAMVRDLLPIVESWRPDVLIRDSAEYGACVVGELVGLPCVSVRTTALSASWDRRSLLAEALDDLRTAHGLPPDPEVAMPFRHLQLVFGPPGFKPPGESFAPTAQVLRPTIFDESGDESLPGWIAERADRPTVYATLGTVVNKSPLFSSVLEALGGLDVNVVVTIGRNRDPHEFGDQPPNIRIASYIPQSLLLPHCDLVVAHGGYNTAIATIAHGLPMVLTPVVADQPENAAWCSEAGIARTLLPDEQTTDSIRAAATEVLTNGRYRATAARVRDEMAALPGFERAVDLIAALVG